MFTTHDTTAGSFAPALRSLGRLEVHGGVSVFGLLPALQRVGSLRIERNGTFHRGLESLQTVEGDFEIIGDYIARAALSSLTRIGGTWRIARARTSSLHIGASSLRARSLALEDNSFPCVARPHTPCVAIDDAMPLRLDPGGTLRIANHTGAAPEELCALVDVLKARGFRGTTELVGLTCPP